MIVEPHWVSEVWVPLGPLGAVTLSKDAAFSFLGQVGTISGLGVTTPLSDLPLDVRIWRQVDSGWQAEAVSAVTPAGDPSSRLLVPIGNDQAATAWPGGTYRIDLLQDDGVRQIQVTFGVQGAAAQAPQPRQPPQVAQLQAMVATPGAFIASGTGAVSFLTAGLPASDDGQHREAQAWLDLGSQQVFSPGGSRPFPSYVGSANLIGVAVGNGQQLLATFLTMVAPVSRDLGRGQLIGVKDSASGPGAASPATNAVAVFYPPDASAGFPSGSYRIDAIVLQDGVPRDVSWDVPLLPRSEGTESPLLGALRMWADLDTTTWSVVAPGYRTSLTPSVEPGIPQDFGPNCAQGADLGSSPPFVGVTHPGPAFDTVVVHRLDGPESGAAVSVEYSQLVAGLVVVRPIASVWLPGRYAITMQTGSQTEQVNFCAS